MTRRALTPEQEAEIVHRYATDPRPRVALRAALAGEFGVSEGTILRAAYEWSRRVMVECSRERWERRYGIDLEFTEAERARSRANYARRRAERSAGES